LKDEEESLKAAERELKRLVDEDKKKKIQKEL
jgi:hypothetical protein